MLAKRGGKLLKSRIQNACEQNMKNSIFSFLVITTLFLLIAFYQGGVSSQTKPFTIGQILRAIASINEATGSRKKLISDKIISDVQNRRVDFPLSKENETLLRNEGATDALIETIRRNSPPLPTLTPTPKPTLTPTSTPTPTPLPTPLPSPTPTPTLTPVPNPSPTTEPTAANQPKVPNLVEENIVNGKAINLARPVFPQAAASLGISGQVRVQVTIDENGNVISAVAESGPAMLRLPAEVAARASKFNPTTVSGQKVKVKGVIVYNFVNSNPPKISPTFTNSIGMEFVLIPNGSFMMGSPLTEKERDADEGPQSRVTISRRIYLGKYEVTQEQWEKVMGTNPSHFKNCPKCPVENVTWQEIQRFIANLNNNGDGKYRLPTEAEWEYACRAGANTKYSFGDDERVLGGYAWFSENGENKTHQVGTKQPNAWGLYDMHGNVREVVEDWKGNYPSSAATTDPTGPASGSNRVGRGGGWYDFSRFLRAAGRFGISPLERDNGVGFRLVKEL